MINYLIGIAIGCAVVMIGYRLVPPKKVQEQKVKIKQLLSEKKDLEHENNDLKLEIKRNRTSINKLEGRMDCVEHRQNQADEWFGSVIRHSRAQFDKDAVERFIEEEGMEEEL